MAEFDSQEIDQKAIRGGFWLLSLRLSTRFLGFVRSVILARLLTPADFGLVGMAMLVIAVLDIVTQTGFDATLVQKKAPSASLINTAWTLQVLRGIILFTTAFLIAPWAAQFFQLSSLDLVIRFIAVSLVVTGIRNIGVVFFQKELRFDQFFKYEIVSSLVDLAVSVILALILRDVWALVWGGLAGNLTRLVMSYLIHPYRPRFFLDTDQLKTILSFGKWILGTGIVYALQVQVDNFTIGKVLGAKELGLYQMAMTLATITTTEISYLIRQVSFPTYSLLQHDMKGLKKAYQSILKLVAVVCLPLGGMLIVLAEEIVFFLFGIRWMDLVPCLKILVLSGLSATFGRLAYPVFLALGHPRYETIFQGLNLAVIAILIFPLTKIYGIMGTAWALTIGNLLVFILSVHTIKKIIDFPIGIHLKILIIPISSTLMMVFVVLALKLGMHDSNIFLRSCLQLVLGTITYGMTLYFLGKKTEMDMIRPLFDKMRRLWIER